MRLDPLRGYHHDLAVLHIAQVARADYVERACLRCEQIATIKLAKDQRPDAERVAGAHDLLVGDADERIGPLDLAQRINEAIDEAILAASRDKVKDHLRIGGRLADGAVANQRLAERQRVREIAVVGDSESPSGDLREQW